MLSARERALAREKQLYDELLDALIAATRRRCSATAGALAELDVLATLAERAARAATRAPELVDEPGIEIARGRHPVRRAVRATQPFVPNDLALDDARSACWSSPARTWAASRPTCARRR